MRLSFITQFKIELLLLFTDYRKVLGYLFFFKVFHFKPGSSRQNKALLLETQQNYVIHPTVYWLQKSAWLSIFILFTYAHISTIPLLMKFGTFRSSEDSAPSISEY